MQPIQVFEIFEKFELEKSRKKRIEILKQHGIPAVRDILRGMFDDTLEFTLPKGKPPYTPNIPESIPSTLLKKHKEFGYFVKGGCRGGRDRQDSTGRSEGAASNQR